MSMRATRMWVSPSSMHIFNPRAVTGALPAYWNGYRTKGQSLREEEEKRSRRKREESERSMKSLGEKTNQKRERERERE
ncbi:hypothetical protein EVAR_44330_1 [Eumeta japonica]|uniref:Uncharacterized protein n=1 Tax=Eumeta variegata TaxID=151549 RepID=A0A4C1X7K3_EUMVA|nr:hypothetical protein EVAR_44330_1 [Eumeta japonica]